jgi:lysyl-tRNA synthetase, class I
MDRLAQEIEDDPARTPGQTLVCASGISPSGPIHLGNLREVVTAHLVAEALRRRGHPAVHLHSWDDYDRLRKVPAGLDPSLRAYIGRPLSAVPDPAGELDSYASHFIAEFTAALDVLGIQVQAVRQSERYPRGDYNREIRRALDQRGEIFDVLAAQQTAGRHDRPAHERRLAYYPFQPYCEDCGADSTQVTDYSGEVVSYSCRCGHRGVMSLADGARISGKLAWKVDWAMRWAHEHVTFEAAGEDHHAPTGSFNVSSQLVRSVYGGVAPHSTVYSFVTMAGVSGKMSGSAGGGAVPTAAPELIEPAVMRWLYARRLPAQSFAIDLGPQAVQRLYDEWDQFARRASAADADAADARVLASCVATTDGEVATTPRPVSFRLLGSAADITQGNTEQIARIVTEHLTPSSQASAPPSGPSAPPSGPSAPPSGQSGPPSGPAASAPGASASSFPLPESTAELIEQLRPRLDCAVAWARQLPAGQRTVVRESFDQGQWEQLDGPTRDGVGILVRGLAGAWTLDGLTTLVYAVPKLMLGQPADAAPTPGVKAAQREFFRALYRLICNADTGPRLPTLMLSIGLDRTTALLAGAARPAAAGLGQPVH